MGLSSYLLLVKYRTPLSLLLVNKNNPKILIKLFNITSIQFQPLSHGGPSFIASINDMAVINMVRVRIGWIYSITNKSQAWHI